MSYNSCATVQIKVEPSEGNPEGVVIINESDFDPAVHTLFEEKPAEEKPAAPVEEKPAVDPAAADSNKPWLSK